MTLEACPSCNYELGSGVYCGNCMAHRGTGSGIRQADMNPAPMVENAQIYTCVSTPPEPATLAKLFEIMREIPTIDPISLDVYKHPFDSKRMVVRARRKHSDTYYNVSAEAIAELERK